MRSAGRVMPRIRPHEPDAAPLQAPRCGCLNPLCLAEDEGRCCRCGRLYVPAPPAACTRTLGYALAKIGAQ